jgi:2-methylaconitate cis-trans-isomerase PrpF
MRGGTSKGVFFRLQDLPEAAQVPGPERDALLLRVIGSPDPYGKQIDGMGGATSSTSKTVILSKSSRPDHDVDYLFGQVSIDKAFVDWSGNCGNLSAAVGPFAISNGLVDASRVPRDGIAIVRIWQANIGKTIVAHVPITNGAVQETGDFELDGVTFPAAEVQLEFKPGVNRKTLAIDGTETFDVTGERTPRADLVLVIHRRNGERVEVPVTCRLDTAEEVSIYEAGGVLQRFARDFLERGHASSPDR